MPGKILMIEDDTALISAVGNKLAAAGYEFESRSNGLEGETRALGGGLDLILLDVMLPGKDGFAVCKSLRDSGAKVPIIMLTGRSGTEDRVEGLKLGADDYLCKPFDMAELLARVAALLRRAGEPQPEGDVPVIDLAKGTIVNAAGEHALSAQEIKLLDYLTRHQDAIVSREELLNSVWGYDSNITTRTIDVHVARLRQKLGDVKDVTRYIHTIRGIGYKYTPPR